MLQWQKRVDLFKWTYSFLITNSKNEAQKQILNIINDAQWIKVADFILDNISSLINKIKQYIPDNWDWDRNDLVDQAIIISSLAEFKIIQTPVAVVIDQAIVTAKKYSSNQKSIKFINAILQKILD